MKVSLNVMKWYSDPDQWQLPLDDLVQKIGVQLGAVEETLDLSGKYNDVFVAEIVAAKDHSNADKLGVYQLNVGQETLQVVAGDKTLNVGDKVAWIKPGATVPSTWGTDHPFIIGAREVRGEISNGMLGSGKELDINDNHAGVQVLDTDTPAGTPFAEAYNLGGDAIIDIENKMFTHRPDGFGHLGVAREIAGIQNLPFTSPDWYRHDAELPEPQIELPLHIKNEIPALVPRFVAVAVAGVQIKPSPLWLQATLYKLGIRPINNIVDITNYYMVLTGQPLHAYDYDKVASLAGGKAELVIRHPKKGEKITVLGGKEIDPHPHAMMVSAGDTLACVGGMIGGANSEVDSSTKNIILEGATWDMYAIRRTSMHNGIFTDAVTRFSKGQSPLQNVAVVARALQEIISIAGGSVGAAIDNVHIPKETLQRGSIFSPVVTTSDFINSRLGGTILASEMAVALGNVECAVEEHGNELVVKPPFWRTDIQIPEDVVEEVGRLHGYENLPHTLPRRDTSAVAVKSIELLKSRIRSLMSQAGANELQTYSFVPARLLQQVGQEKTHAFAIRNALSPELEHYRLSLTPSLLEKVHPNIKAGYDTFGLFEINKIHIKGDDDCDGLPREYQTVAFVFASNTKLPGAAYYRAKRYLDYLLDELGVPYHIQPIEQSPNFEIGRQVFAPFEPKRAGYVYAGDNDFAGFVGEYRLAVGKYLKLPETCAGFEIDLERLLKYQHAHAYRSLLKFPATSQDISLKVKKDIQYAQLKTLVYQSFASDERLRVTTMPLDIYQRTNDSEHVQITFRITLQHHDRTLTTSEVNDMLDAVVQKVGAAVGARRV